MQKLYVRNMAGPEWNQVIEDKLRIMLGSMMVHIIRIDIELNRTVSSGDQRTPYRCKLVLVDSHGERYQLHNDQLDATLAIEGAIARGRRALTRLSRARAPGRRQASMQ